MRRAATANGIGIMDVLASWARDFESVIDSMLVPDPAVPPVLSEAVRYSVQGGKRVRAFIVTRICELCGGTAEMAAPAAVALECVHAFSLVHDDLPAMDDDDLRRGRPTCHKAFGEAEAILAGDALLALAFEIPATGIVEPAVVKAVVAELAKGTGWAGMIGGQTTDIQSEAQPPELGLVQRIHRYKTARLFVTAGRLGAYCARAEEAQLAAASAYGQHLGLAFQIADDLLDVTGSAEQMGKAVAKDAEAGKQTYPGAVGIEASRAAARDEVRKAIQALEIFGPAAEDLRQLANYIVERRH
ncbi:MAG: polyprenyl synthetase family protein [Phycisphaerae bacterium]|nr:polyprenyl synthetase family protein [Phycisphaerae bacterium]